MCFFNQLQGMDKVHTDEDLKALILNKQKKDNSSSFLDQLAIKYGGLEEKDKPSKRGKKQNALVASEPADLPTDEVCSD
jgi:hypothetical protein